jgi:hypothetical protein
MKRFMIIRIAGFAVFFGSASTAEAGGYGYRTYYRSTCGPSHYRGYYRSYNCYPRYYTYDHCAPRYYYHRPYSYGYCAPRYYHRGITIAVPGFGFHICR